MKELVDVLNGNASIRLLKNQRNALVDSYFRRRDRSKGEALADLLRAESTQKVCFTIAFNAPWTLDLLTAAWGKYCKSFRLVVIDNSSSAKDRASNLRICEARSLAYLGLPSNPEWSPNRSHGISMNWTYHNVVRRLRPAEFGFIDHDCFPIVPFDFSERLAGRSVYGLRKFSGKRPGMWNLWAGFCFYRFADAAERPLNYTSRFELGLDTGGGNWNALYKGLGEDAVGAASMEIFDIDNFDVQMIDDAFIHLGGASYRGRFKSGDLRKALSERIWKNHLDGCSPVLGT